MKDDPKWLWEGRTVDWNGLAQLVNTPSATTNIPFARFAAKTRMVELMLEWLDTPMGKKWRNHVTGAATPSMLMNRASEVFGWGLGRPPNSTARVLSRPAIPRLKSLDALLGDL